MQTRFLLCLLPLCGCKTILSDLFIHDINNKNSSWTAGQNFPQNTPISLLMKLNGAREDPGSYNVEIKTHNITEKIPETFDAREIWPRCESIGKIRNQGFCGSCWAFGAAETMSDRLCIVTNATQQFQFSPEHLLSCCKECGYGCNGGYSSKAWEFWVNEGVVSGGDHEEKSEGCQPYSKQAFVNSTTPECNSQCSNKNYETPFEEDRKFGVSNFRLPSEMEQIQYEIMKNGPVQATYAVFEDFYSYKSGVYQHLKGEKSGYHAVKIIGWGFDKVPYWLVANSWGPKWGESGFFKILRGQNHCGIEGNVLGGLPKIESGR